MKRRNGWVKTIDTGKKKRSNSDKQLDGEERQRIDRRQRRRVMRCDRRRKRGRGEEGMVGGGVSGDGGNRKKYV